MLLAGFCLLGWRAVAAVSADERQVVLQLPYTHQFQFAGIYAAQFKGYFEAEGLAVEVRQNRADDPAVPAVLEGRAAYGVFQATAILRQRFDQKPLVVVSSLVQHSPYALASRRDAGIRNPQDLAGKRIALESQFRAFEIRMMLEKEGVDFSTVTIVPNRWEVDEIATGEADAMGVYFNDTPYDLRRNGMEVNLIRPLDYGVDFYGDCLFTSEAEVKAHPGRAAAMQRAVRSGWAYALQHPEEVIDWILANLPDRPERVTRDRLRFEVENMQRLFNAELVAVGHNNPDRWRTMADQMRRMGVAVDSSRLDGLFFDPPREWDLSRSLWAGGAVLGVAVLGLLAFWSITLRLRRLVDQRTRELRESERRQREIFDLAPVPITRNDYTALVEHLDRLRATGVTDLNAHLAQHAGLVREWCALVGIVDANQLALRFAGVGTVAELDRRRMAMLTPESISDFRQALLALWEKRNQLRIESSYLATNGRRRDIMINWSAPGSPGHPDYTRVQVVYTDVTELRDAGRALVESESRYRELFESAIDGIYRSTPGGRIITANPALARILGFDSAQELIDCNQNVNGHAFYVVPGRRKEFLAEQMANGHVANFESEVRGKSGARIWISENARFVRDQQGNGLYFEGFVSDITMHRRLDQEMQRASKLEAVGILAGGIAHDFNNILTVVLGNITLAEMDAGPGAPGARLLLEAKRATLRARDLTQQLLTFAKGGEPVREAMDLAELLRETTDFALHGAKARADYQIAKDLWPVNADKGQLGQVVQNLVINSVQAMPDGGVLRVSADNATLDHPAESLPLPAGRYVRFMVADSGTGIAMEHLAKIFDPYFTTKQQGSGLGLATVYSIVRKHQGHIEVESQLGRGTTFQLWLPAAAHAVAPAAVARAARTPLRARVLFMDDEESIRSMAGGFMSRLGLEHEMAVDGAEAERKFQEALAANRPFDVVVMDLTVPGGMGGRETLELLRRIDPSVRAIVSSGYSHDPVMASYRAHGFQAVLPKPYDLDQLRQALEETLGNRPSRQHGSK